MDIIGDLFFKGIGRLKNASFENLAEDPSTPRIGQIWFNTSLGVYKGYDGTAVFTFSTGGSATAIQAELNTTQLSAGLNANGTLPALDAGGTYWQLQGISSIAEGLQGLASNQLDLQENFITTISMLGTGGASWGGVSGAHYIAGSTSAVSALNLLDAQVYANATGLSSAVSEVNAIETAVGLNTNGTFISFSGTNYLNGSTSLANGLGLLDVALDAVATTSGANTTAIGTKVSKAGDSMTGNLSMGGTYTVTNLAAPTANDHAATKLYVDSAISGLRWKDPVVAAAATNIALSGLLTVDGVTLTTNARVLVMGQTDATANGIYLAKSSAWVRAEDFDQTTPVNEVNDAAVLVVGGNTFKGYGFTQINSVAALGTDDLAFVQFNGSATLTAGTGLAQTGNTLNVNLGAGINEGPTDEIGIDLYDQANSALILTVDGSARSTGGATQLALLLADTSLAQTSAGLKIADNGVGIDEVDASVAGAGLQGGSGVALSVHVDDASLEIASDIVGVKALGITNAMLAGSIANSKLVNSTVSVQDTQGVTQTLALGALLHFMPSNTVNFTWTGAGEILVEANVAMDEISNVAMDSPQNGQALIYDSGSWVNTRVRYEFDGTASASASHVVIHNLGKKYCNVTVVDSADKVIIPDSITFDTTNQLTITFSSAITCRAIVS